MYVFAPERQGKISGREVFEAGTKFGEGCSCVLHEVFVSVENNGFFGTGPKNALIYYYFFMEEYHV